MEVLQHWRWPEFFGACNLLSTLDDEHKKIESKHKTNTKGGSYVQSLRDIGILKNGN